MKKKLLMYFLMLMLAFSFTACSGDDDSSSKRSERDKDDEDEDDEDKDDKKDKDEDKDDEDDKSEDEDSKSNDEDEKTDDEDEKVDDEEEKTDDDKDDKKPSLNLGNDELSNNLYDYKFSVNGEVYQLPMWFTEFEELGWEYDSDRDYLLDAGDYEYDIFIKDGVEMWVDINNYSINSTPVKDCLVTYAEFGPGYVTEDSEIKFANDIQLYVSTKDDVLAAYGEPNELDEYDDETYYYYYEDEEYAYEWNCIFRFNNETGTLDYAEICHAIEVEGFDNTIHTEAPEFLDDYVAPTELGSDIFDTAISLEGDYYALPCPVGEFFNNGYKLPEYYEVDYVPGGDTYYIDFERDGKNISVIIENFTPYATSIENCYVTGISHDASYGDEWDYVISGNITIGSTVDELMSALGEYEYSTYEYTDSTTYSAYEDTWYYSNYRYFEVKEGIVTYINSQCNENPAEEE